jgi:hypothetical protein
MSPAVVSRSRSFVRLPAPLLVALGSKRHGRYCRFRRSIAVSTVVPRCMNSQVKGEPIPSGIGSPSSWPYRTPLEDPHLLDVAPVTCESASILYLLYFDV